MWTQCRRVINRKRLLERESESTLEIKTTYRSNLKYIHQVQECVWVWAEFIGVYYLRTPLLNANIKERSEKSRGTWLPRQDFVCKVFYSKYGDYNIHILLLGPEIVTTDSKATPMLLTVSRMTIIWLARLGFIWEFKYYSRQLCLREASRLLMSMSHKELVNRERHKIQKYVDLVMTKQRRLLWLDFRSHSYGDKWNRFDLILNTSPFENQELRQEIWSQKKKDQTVVV